MHGSWTRRRAGALARCRRIYQFPVDTDWRIDARQGVFLPGTCHRWVHRLRRLERPSPSQLRVKRGAATGRAGDYLLLPNLADRKNKSWQDRITIQGGGSFKALNLFTRTVHVNFLLKRIDEPAELRAVLHVFGHLRLKDPKPHGPSIAWRHQFDNEVGTNGRRMSGSLLKFGGSPNSLVDVLDQC